MGPERLQTNTCPVRGPVGAFAGCWATTPSPGCTTPLQPPDGEAGPHSFLLRYGNWVPSEGDEEGVAQFVGRLRRRPGGVAGQGDHRPGLLRHPVGGRRRRRGAGNPRLFAGFADGTLRLGLPAPQRAQPLRPESGCDFATGVSFLRWPRHSMDAPADLKAYLSFDLSGRCSTPTATSTSCTASTPPTRGPLGAPRPHPVADQRAGDVPGPHPGQGDRGAGGATGPRRPRPTPGAPALPAGAHPRGVGRGCTPRCWRRWCCGSSCAPPTAPSTG